MLFILPNWCQKLYELVKTSLCFLILRAHYFPSKRDLYQIGEQWCSSPQLLFHNRKNVYFDFSFRLLKFDSNPLKTTETNNLSSQIFQVWILYSRHTLPFMRHWVRLLWSFPSSAHCSCSCSPYTSVLCWGLSTVIPLNSRQPFMLSPWGETVSGLVIQASFWLCRKHIQMSILLITNRYINLKETVVNINL